jgi:hypothetical protein
MHNDFGSKLDILDHPESVHDTFTVQAQYVEADLNKKSCSGTKTTTG